MPTKKHRLAPEVESELDDIWLYLASRSDSIEIADRVIDNITDRFRLLANNPYIGRRRDEDLRPGLRSFSVEDYIIIYRIEADAVLILHVIHGSRNLKALLVD
jgi:toxin ParE1/3/4